MENTLKAIESALRDSKIEKTDNIFYQIKCNNLCFKEELKKHLKQGDSSCFHTVVEIDFNTSKDSKTKRNESSIETTSFPEYNIVIKIWNSPIYIYGEYIKLSREMTQTPLKIKGKFKTERSVSDFGSEFTKFFNGSCFKFMGCGREDMDVRCLEGRPFIIEITNPTANINAKSMDIELFNDIFIKNCNIATKECKDFVNKEDPSKFYNVLIYSNEKIQFNRLYELEQKTPLRVLHRRANMIRLKSIEILKTEEFIKNGYYYEIEIKASSGAYIKEWVTGDFGRTIPNLNSDCLELDVITIDLKPDQNHFVRPLILNIKEKR